VCELEDGKIKRFDWSPQGSIIFAQPGVLTKLETAVSHRQRDEQDRKTLLPSHRLIAEMPVTNIVAAQSMPIPGMQ
jgi:hypothetical protein